MKKVLFYLSVALSSLFLGSCDISNDDDINFHFVALEITDVEVPESFDLNETYEIKVTFQKPNSCTFFERFEVSNDDTTVRSVFVIGTEIDDQACSQTVEEVETSFQFVVLYSQTYLFKFWSGENADGEQQYIEVEVPVNTMAASQ